MTNREIAGLSMLWGHDIDVLLKKSLKRYSGAK